MNYRGKKIFCMTWFGFLREESFALSSLKPFVNHGNFGKHNIVPPPFLKGGGGLTLSRGAEDEIFFNNGGRGYLKGVGLVGLKRGDG